MSKEKSAMFIDNSNIFIGLFKFSRILRKKGEIKENDNVRIRWERVIQLLENQSQGIDVFARHFFASLPPAADISSLKKRPTEEEWEELVKKQHKLDFIK